MAEVRAADAVVIVTNHQTYDYAAILRRRRPGRRHAQRAGRRRQGQPESGEAVMARYLVTGAAGFIASRVTEMLLDDGHR